jgi:hypothetical protein
MVIDAEVRLQYLSNSGFLLTTEEGRRVVIDPYLTGNAAAPFGAEKIPPLDLIIVTHAAFDHLGDAFILAKRDGASLVCDYLVRQLAYAEGLSKEQVKSCSYGGTVYREGVTLRVLQATHTSYTVDDVGRPSTGISKAKPMQTGFDAWRFGLVGFIIPFVMVFNPELSFFTESYLTVSLIFLLSAAGVFSFVAFERGFLLHRCAVPSRILLLLIAIALFYPLYWIKIVGLESLIGMISIPHLMVRHKTLKCGAIGSE